MNSKTSENSARVSAFHLTIVGEQCPERPELLGRDVRYVLNVKAIGQNGEVIEGARYTVNCEISPNAMIFFPRLGEQQVSTVAGENFSLYGAPATSDQSYPHMNTALKVIVTSEAGVSTQADYLMGRLCYWSTLYIYPGLDANIVIFSHAEWVGEGSVGWWHWSSNVDQAQLNIPSKDIAESVRTYDAEGVTWLVFVSTGISFTPGERVGVLIPSSWNEYTATLPYDEEVEVRSEPYEGEIKVFSS